jgi:hypothetical protein
MTEITSELLQTIYNRAIQYAIAAKGSAPDYINLEDDGRLNATWETYWRGDTEYEHIYIAGENLSDDLDAVAEKRKIDEEKQRQDAMIRAKEEQKRREENEKENRRRQFLKLQAEFGK